MTDHNLERFLIHVGFGLGAVLLGVVATQISSLNLPPDVAGALVVLATAAASFMRSKSA